MAADPVLAYDRPDVDALVHDTVKDFGGVTNWVYAANDVGLRGWLIASSVQVDVRASSRAAAWQRAEAVRRTLCDLPSVPWDGGVVTRVNVLEGPQWLPDPDGAPRFVARYEFIAHPTQKRR